MLLDWLVIIGVAAVGMTVIAEVLSMPLARIFVNYDKDLIDMSTRALRLFSISYLISGFNVWGSAFFTALNDGLVSAVISGLRTLVFQVIAIYTLPLVFGIDGIWLAIVIAELLGLVVTITFIMKNRVKYRYF